jgi:FKBP-type peptidyl-prolyl cis-trans isomerase FklB
MKRLLLTLGVSAAALTHMLAQPKVPTTDVEKISYSLGADIGKNFRMQEIRIDVPMMARGIGDAMGGGKLALSDEEIQKTIAAFQEVMMKVQQEKSMKDAYENREAGEKFLEENKKKEGVVALPSGLQYKVITEGNGPKPAATDQVSVHYSGKLLSGKVFDSSYKRNEPATFRLSQVIKGWTEGVQLMSVGSKYEFFIPSDLGYGDRQMGPDITPGSLLIFELELLGIKK